jgi:penicillin-binding protein 2
MSVIHAPPKREVTLREMLPLLVLFGALAVIFLRLWYLQIVQGEALAEKAQAIRTNRVAKIAPRGLIFDRNGTMVAGVQPEIVLTALPGVVKKNPWVLDKVSQMVGVSAEKLAERVKQSEWRPHLPAPIHVGVPIEVAARILESAGDLPGIGIESQPMRFVPDTVSLCHLLGYVWIPSDRDVERLRALSVRPAEYVGKDGLERVYETDLMGRTGSETLEMDARRRPLRIVGRDTATPGSRLILGIDLKLQQLAQKLLEGRRGGVAAIDPKTGEVLCLVSSPAFDAGYFQRGISTENWRMLQDHPDKPLINRAVVSRYSPGSTFKIVVALAAMEKGIFSPTWTAHCRGVYAPTRTRCLGVHGSISFHRAFTVSCNVYFATLGTAVGPEALKATCLRVGLGERTGIDLPAENPGLIPTKEWLESRKPPLGWYPGDQVNMSIGQGATAATPLQMACVAALVANGGTSFRPHLVRGKVPNGSERVVPIELETLAKLDLPAEHWKALQAAMVSVIDQGTARVAQIPGISWGGKTGSAEHRKREQTHSWFVGIAPMDDPKIAICVLVEAAGHGSTVAAPVARDLVRYYLKKEAPEQPEPAPED